MLLLGPDGRASFSPDGGVTITFCDRTFDDDRLAKLAKVIESEGLNDNVVGFLCGSGNKTGGSAAAWPGLTDASLPLILRWKGLELLVVANSAISGDGKAQLRELPHLNEVSLFGLRE